MPNTTINVMQFICPAGYYGAERWITAICRASMASDVKHTVVATEHIKGQELEITTQIKAIGCDAIQLKSFMRFDPFLVMRLVKIIRERNIDIVHSHGYKSDIIGALAARIAGIRCITTPHGFGNSTNFKFRAYLALGKLAYRLMDRIVPLSPALYELHVQMNVPTEKLCYIANGLDISEITHTKNGAKTAIHPAEQIIGSVGRLVEGKGFKDLIVSFTNLYQGDERLRLKIIGEGLHRSELEALIITSPARAAIELLGFREDRFRLVSTFEVFVMTSASEGIPRSMMEAMALGVPCVAYDIPGVDQLIIDGHTGLLATLGDTKHLSDQCQRLLSDRSLAMKISAAAEKHVHNNFSSNKMAKSYESLYRELL